jgi:hypothetical protein
MTTVAGGILLALIFLLCLPLLLRTFLVLVPLAGMVLLGALLLGTACRRELLPAVIAIGVFGAAMMLMSRRLDHRDAERRKRTGWRLLDR